MRIATLIIGLIVSLWIMFEGWLTGILFSAGDDTNKVAASWLGFFAGFIALVGSALVVAFPLASMVIFTLAGLTSLWAAAAGYPNHSVFCVVLFAFAVMSFFGWRGKRKERREKTDELQRQRDRDDRLESLLRTSQAAMTRCPSCGGVNPAGARFCATCGATMTEPVVLSNQGTLPKVPQKKSTASYFDAMSRTPDA